MFDVKYKAQHTKSSSKIVLLHNENKNVSAQHIVPISVSADYSGIFNHEIYFIIEN